MVLVKLACSGAPSQFLPNFTQFMTSSPESRGFLACHPRPEVLSVWFSTSESTQVPRHEHAGAELNIVMAGSLKYEVEGEFVEAGAGTIVVLPPRKKHDLVHVSDDVALWVLEMSQKATPGWMGETMVRTPVGTWKAELLSHLRKLWIRPDQARVAALEELLISATRAPQWTEKGPSAELHPAVQKTRMLVPEFGADEVDIKTLAKKAGISASRLANLFQQQLGLTPLQYRNYIRMQQFIRLADGNDRDLMRAALRAGFGSYAQFHRICLQVCGGPPGAHLKWLATTENVHPQRTLRSEPPPAG